jgi:hypothetical protein
VLDIFRPAPACSSCATSASRRRVASGVARVSSERSSSCAPKNFAVKDNSEWSTSSESVENTICHLLPLDVLRGQLITPSMLLSGLYNSESGVAASTALANSSKSDGDALARAFHAQLAPSTGVFSLYLLRRSQPVRRTVLVIMARIAVRLETFCMNIKSL